MALNARQTKLYTDTCTLYSRTRTISGAGVPGSETITAIATGVSYFHEVTDNISDPGNAGRLTQDNLLTADKAHFDVAQTLPDGGYLKNTTSGGSLSGKVYAIVGPARLNPSRGARKTNKATILVREMEKVPAGIS